MPSFLSGRRSIPFILETPQDRHRDIHKTGPPERNRQPEAKEEQGAQEAKAGGPSWPCLYRPVGIESEAGRRARVSRGRWRRHLLRRVGWLIRERRRELPRTAGWLSREQRREFPRTAGWESRERQRKLPRTAGWESRERRHKLPRTAGMRARGQRTRLPLGTKHRNK